MIRQFWSIVLFIIFLTAFWNFAFSLPNDGNGGYIIGWPFDERRCTDLSDVNTCWIDKGLKGEGGHSGDDAFAQDLNLNVPSGNPLHRGSYNTPCATSRVTSNEPRSLITIMVPS